MTSRVLFITDTGIDLPVLGGSERHLLALSRGLQEHGHQVSVVQLYHRADGPRHDSDGIFRFPIRRLNSTEGLRQMWRVHDLIRRTEPDIVQTFHEKSDLIAAMCPGAGRLRLVSSRRDLGFKRSWAIRTAARVIDRRFHGFVYPSAAVEDVVRQNRATRRAVHRRIVNGVDVEYFRPPAPGEKAAARDTLQLSADQRVVVCVANLRPVKGVNHLLDAFARLPARQETDRLLLVGGGRLEPDLRAQADRLGVADQVRFVGHQKDVRPFLRAADYLVLPSLSEGLPNSVLEAAAAGLPVVATRVGGVPEVIIHDVNGLLVEPGSADSLADAMQMLHGDPERRAAIARAARETARKQFSIDRMVAEHESLYAQLTGNDWEPAPIAAGGDR